MLEGRQHALEHLPVDLVVLALDEELGGLAGVGSRLTDNAREPRDMPLERHHPRLHQAVLKLGRDSRLLSQQRLGLVREAAKQLVDARDVVRRLGERARQLLNRRVAIELERIETGVARDVVLMSMEDLRLGLGLELAELIAQPRHRRAELAEMELDRLQLLREPRLENVDLARAVQKHVEQCRVDARSLGTFRGTPVRCGRLRDGRRRALDFGRPRTLIFGSRRPLRFAGPLHLQARDSIAFLNDGRVFEDLFLGSRLVDGRLVEAAPCGAASTSSASAEGSSIDSSSSRFAAVSAIAPVSSIVGAGAAGAGAAATDGVLGGCAAQRGHRRGRRRDGLGRGLDLLRRARRRGRWRGRRCRCGCRHTHGRGRMLDLADERVGRRHSAARVDGVAHLLELVERTLHDIESRGRGFDVAAGNPLDQRLERVAQRAHRRDAGHPRSALERVQQTLELDGRGRRGILTQRAQRELRVVENLGRLLGENRGDLGDRADGVMTSPAAGATGSAGAAATGRSGRAAAGRGVSGAAAGG